MMEALETVLLIKKKTGDTILSQEIFKYVDFFLMALFHCKFKIYFFHCLFYKRTINAKLHLRYHDVIIKTWLISDFQAIWK